MDTVPFIELSSLPVAGIALYFMYRLSTNHIGHSIKAIEKLTEAIDRQSKASQEFHGWFKGWIGETNGEKD